MAPKKNNASTVSSHILIKGSGQKLADAIKSKNYIGGWSTHPWADGRTSTKGQMGLQAHHIITTKNLNTKEWKKFREAYEYDINTFNNGVMLPSRTDVACQVYTQVHKSGHSGGLDFNSIKSDYWAESSQSSEKVEPVKQVPDHEAKILSLAEMKYLKSVNKDTNNIKVQASRGYYCKAGNAKKFQDDMDDVSTDILVCIDSFLYTISSFGQDYSKVSNIGCAGDNNVESIGKSRSPCPCRNAASQQEKHNIKNGLGVVMKPRKLEVGK